MLLFEKIAPDIERLRVPLGSIWTGVFLVRGPQNFLIDSGSNRQDAEQIILPALSQAGIAPEDITFLLCTHCHGDHVGGHRALAETGMPVACFAGSKEKLKDPLRFSKEIRAAFPENSPAAPASLQGCEPERVLADGERLGGYLRLIHTPGHDTDSVCFLDERTGTLITGDSLQWDGTVTQGTALVMALPDYLDSLTKVEALRPERILPGHPYLPSGDRIEGEEECRQSLKMCRACMDEYGAFLRDLWQSGTHELPKLASALISHIGHAQPEYLFLALYTVRELLVAQGLYT